MRGLRRTYDRLRLLLGQLALTAAIVCIGGLGYEFWKLRQADRAAEVKVLAPLEKLRAEGWRLFTDKEGLPSKEVYWLLEAPDGDLWASTARGPARFSEGRWQGFPEFSKKLLYGYVAGMVLDNRGIPWVTGVEPRHMLWTPALAAVGAAYFDGTTFKTVRRGRFVHVAPCSTGQVFAFAEVDTLFQVAPTVKRVELPESLRRGFCCGGLVCDKNGVLWLFGDTAYGTLRDETWVLVDGENAQELRYPGSRPGDVVFRDCSDGIWIRAEKQNAVSVVRGTHWTQYPDLRQAIATEAPSLRGEATVCNTLPFAASPGGLIFHGFWRFDGREWMLLDVLRRQVPNLALYSHLARPDGTVWISTSIGVLVPPADILRGRRTTP